MSALACAAVNAMPSSGLPAALFEPRDDGTAGATDVRWPRMVRPTELTRGPWSHGIMHGSGICGLLGWALEAELVAAVADARRAGRDVARLVCSRMTVEMLSGVELADLSVSAQVVKLGRRTAVVDASFGRPGELALARATSQWLAPLAEGDAGAAGVSAGPSASVRPRADALPSVPLQRANPGAHSEINYPRPGFNADAVDLRYVEGSTEMPGRGVVWMRLDVPLMAGEPTSPFGLVATLSDFGAAVGWDFAPSGGALINTDVTLQLLRAPVGEWLLFESETVLAGAEPAASGAREGGDGDDSAGENAASVSCNHTRVYDQQGAVGWVLQSQLDAPHDIGLPGGVAAAAKETRERA